MSAILRWFEYSGERHRVYFRYLGDETQRTLVVAGPGWQRTLDDVRPARLEDLPDELLAELARRCRPRDNAAAAD